MILAALLLQAAAPPPPGSKLGFVCTPIGNGKPGCIPTMKPPRVYDGVWLDEFEDQQFFDHARVPADVQRRNEGPWFDIDRLGTLRAYVDRRSPGARLPDPYLPHFYHVRFVGREAENMNCSSGPFQCYGHMGGSAGLIVADRVLTIEDLGPLPLAEDAVSSGNRR